MLAGACTVHKIQGLSLTKIIVSLQLLKQRQFNYGQIYAALSKVTTLKSLYIPSRHTASQGRPLMVLFW